MTENDIDKIEVGDTLRRVTSDDEHVDFEVTNIILDSRCPPEFEMKHKTKDTIHLMFWTWLVYVQEGSKTKEWILIKLND